MSDRPITDGGSNSEPGDEASHLRYDISDDELPSQAIIRATASLTDTPPLDLDPLYDVIPPAHLDGSIQDTDDDTVKAEFSFAFNGCEVTVTGDEVHVRQLDETG